MTLRVLLVCEGSSDTGLVAHIQQLLIMGGVSDPMTESHIHGRYLSQRIRSGLELTGDCDILLVHRDADSQLDTGSAGPGKRLQEIESAVVESGYCGPWVGVIPIHAMESWLLANPSAIGAVVGNPEFVERLDLPPPSRIESISDPKEVLQATLETASGQSGRRLRRIRRDFPHHRQILLENLPVGGPLQFVPSWCRFRDDTLAAICRVKEGSRC